MVLQTCRSCQADLAGIPFVQLGTAYRFKGSHALCLDCLPKPDGESLFKWIVEYCRQQVDPVLRLKMENEELRQKLQHVTTERDDLKRQNTNGRYKQ